LSFRTRQKLRLFLFHFDGSLLR